MESVFIISHNITSPLGFSSEENFDNLVKGNTGVALQHEKTISDEGFYASLFTKDNLNSIRSESNSVHFDFSKFESIIVHSISKVLKTSNIDVTSKDTIIIYSSTKGNVGILESGATNEEAISLSTSANLINVYFKNPNKAIVVSNACISGSLALIVAKRLLENKQYKNAIVVGADIITKFIFSGFQSFQALSSELCKPFSEDRKGINLGEAAATIVLSTNKNEKESIIFAGGAVTNDANHISGPSRTGEELKIAIEKALVNAGIIKTDIDLISAHGTATVFNDEMESKAINLVGISNCLVNSLKGYYGHTLGASGIVEVIISTMSMKSNTIIPTKGFTKLGVPQYINVCETLTQINIKHVLKTASGFGGCNAAIILSKI